MSATTKFELSVLTSRVFITFALFFSCFPGCGSDSREDFKAGAPPKMSSPSVADMRLPPVMVGQTYSFTMAASSDSPARLFTGAVKSVSDEAVVLASPVEQSNIEPNPSVASSTTASDVEIITKDVSLACGEIAKLAMVFTPAAN